MDESLIKDYLATFQKKKFKKIIERDLHTVERLEKATSIIGPRRAGKTYYFFSKINAIGKEKCIYLDFEEPFLRELKDVDVLKIILEIFPELNGGLPSHVFLDEIQNLENWQSVVRSLLNKGRFHVYITGSSSKLLSKEIATQLRGRTFSYLLLPFSFKEFLKAKGFNLDLNLLSSRGILKKMLEEYLDFGGFPEVVLEEEKERTIKEYLDLAFFKDFVERHEIKSIQLARYLFNHIIQNFSAEVSVRKIEKRLKGMGLKFTTSTLYKYVDSLEDTLFVFFLRKFSWKPHMRETWPKKVYLCDTGLNKIAKHSQDLGKRMENVVFLELLRKTNERSLMEVYYWKDYQQREVDFVVKEGMRVKELIQVTYASSRDEVERREIKSLLKASELLKCKNLKVITWDYEDMEEFEGKKVEFVPLWKWLLKL